MQYKLINWIKTNYWEGALIQDQNSSKQFLTNGISRWGSAPHRTFEVINSISDEAIFHKRWRENFPYDHIIK